MELQVEERLMLGEPPKAAHSPMEKGDQPELNAPPELGPGGIEKFQSLIGASQWMIALCCFDVAQAAISLGQFHAAPCEGHMTCLKHLIGCIKKQPSYAI